ncbi:MAG: hypothetical protein P9M01_00935, partial [Candidatus Kappaea frigidicola]|nr:hypothetical protein [Candidatus Kappaea frigidicola]
MIEKREDIHSGVIIEARSGRFKPVMQMVAFIVIFCFLYQDLSSTMRPDYATTLNLMLQGPAPIPANPLLTFFCENAYAEDYGSDYFYYDDYIPNPDTGMDNYNNYVPVYEPQVVTPSDDYALTYTPAPVVYHLVDPSLYNFTDSTYTSGYDTSQTYDTNTTVFDNAYTFDVSDFTYVPTTTVNSFSDQSWDGDFGGNDYTNGQTFVISREHFAFETPGNTVSDPVSFGQGGSDYLGKSYESNLDVTKFLDVSGSDQGWNSGANINYGDTSFDNSLAYEPSPSDITYTNAGYVADWGNDKVEFYSYENQSSTLVDSSVIDPVEGFLDKAVLAVTTLGGLIPWSGEKAAQYEAVHEEVPYFARPWGSSNDGLSIINPGANFGTTISGFFTNDVFHKKFFETP